MQKKVPRSTTKETFFQLRLGKMLMRRKFFARNIPQAPQKRRTFPFQNTYSSKTINCTNSSRHYTQLRVCQSTVLRVVIIGVITRNDILESDSLLTVGKRERKRKRKEKVGGSSSRFCAAAYEYVNTSSSSSKPK